MPICRTACLPALAPTLLALLGGAGAGAQPASPPEMAEIDGACIDRWEAFLIGQSPYEIATGGRAASASGSIPQGYISGVAAASACAQAGKRLCTDTEWLRACRGPAGTTFPYGDVYDPDKCNDSRAEHPVVTLFGAGATFSFEQLTDLVRFFY